MTKQEHLDLIKENGYSIPEFVDTHDCISPWEDTPNLLVISDDAMNAWEFLDGKLIGQGNMMGASMMQIRGELEKLPEHKRGKKFLKIQKEIRSLWGHLDKSVDLEDASWKTDDNWR